MDWVCVHPAGLKTSINGMCGCCRSHITHIGRTATLLHLDSINKEGIGRIWHIGTCCDIDTTIPTESLIESVIC